MIVLSFDIGIKNLAYCQLDSEACDILDWHIIDCSNSKPELIILTLIEELEKISNLLDSDTILIEKQPSFNPKMRIISTAIYVYFTLRIAYEQQRKIKILYYSAKHKLKLCSETEALQNKSNSRSQKAKRQNYYKNKKAAIEQTQLYLCDNDFLPYFMKSKKKDDLADCYLQAIIYLN
jgi:hypothetical protein